MNEKTEEEFCDVGRTPPEYERCKGLEYYESGCSEKPNDQKKYTGKICGNCDAYCECGLGPDPAKHDDVACPGFDDSVLSQLKK
ncbi:hypothetical protein DW103_17380 [Parabacteroides sp. AM08-6]|nr:hypothetical protein DW103_17380 [Parabacteroides sp. AM08-6]